MPRKFTFRLEKVLRLRQTAEDECRRRVAARLREIARIESDVRSLDEQYDWEVSRSREHQRSSAMDVMTLRRRRSYMVFLQRQKAECERCVREAQRKLQSEQDALDRASKEVKVLDKLRERQWARHSQDERRRERAAEDEIAQSWALRRRRENAAAAARQPGRGFPHDRAVSAG